MGRPTVVVVPFPAQGHVNPLMNFSKIIAKHGYNVTFVNTQFNQKRMLGASDSSPDSGGGGSSVEFVAIPDGMGPDEDRDDLAKLTQAMLSTMPQKLEELFQDLVLNKNLKCVVVDGSMGWALEVAAKLGIRSAMYWTSSALCAYLVSNPHRLVHDGILDCDGLSIKKQKFQLSSGVPIIDPDNFPWSIGDSTSQKILFEYTVRLAESFKLSELHLCNSAYELEPEAFSSSPKLLPIGPMVSIENSGAQFWEEDQTCLEWLDLQKPKSVIYVAFGSFTIFDRTQFQELARGIELTNKPFLWVVRPGGSNNQLPEEFRGIHGKIVSWTPQAKVLKHPAIACFLSHCGWNSTIEGLCNGVPFLCWPYFSDQFVNKGYICDTWKVGFGFEKNQTGIVVKEEILGKIELLLGDENVRERSLKLKEIVRNSTEEDGKSWTNFKNFMELLEA